MIQLDAGIEGLREFELKLREIAPDLKKQMDREIRRALQPVRTKAQSLAPQRPLSGWRTREGTGRWSGDRAYQQRAVKSGIRIRKINPRRNAGAARSYGRIGSSGFQGQSEILTGWQIQNRSAAGVIFELAGRDNPSGKSDAGRYFIRGLNRTAGPSRLIWRAWDQLDGERKVILDSAETSIRNTERKLASLIGAKVT